MVVLRSDGQDKGLIVLLWVLTLAVLGIGIALVKPVLIFWGVLGVSGSVFLTRIHVRDTRATSAAAATAVGGGPGAGEPEAEEESGR